MLRIRVNCAVVDLVLEAEMWQRTRLQVSANLERDARRYSRYETPYRCATPECAERYRQQVPRLSKLVEPASKVRCR